MEILNKLFTGSILIYPLLACVVWIIYQNHRIKNLIETSAYLVHFGAMYHQALYLFLRGNNTPEEEDWMITVATPVLDRIVSDGHPIAGYVNENEIKNRKVIDAN